MSSFEFTGSDVQPVPMPRSRAVGKALPHPANSPFILYYSPYAWAYLEATGEWIPQLLRAGLSPGEGGVDKDGDIVFLKANLELEDAYLIPLDATPDGSEYVQAWPAAGGLYYAERWETPRALGRKPVQSVIDTEGRLEWLRWLVSSGRIPAPTDVTVGPAIEAQRGAVEELRKHAARNPQLKDALERQEAKLKAMSAPPKIRKPGAPKGAKP